MKTNLVGKTVLPLLVMLLAVVTLSSCDQSRKKIEQMIQNTNKDCPVEIGDIGVIKSMQLQENDVVINGEIEEDEYVTLDAIGQNKEIFGASLFLALDNDFLNEVAKAGYTIKYICHGKKTGKSVTYTIDSDGLNRMIEKNYSEQDLYKALLSSVVKIVKQNTVPTKIEEGMVMTDICMEGNNVVYVISMDEDIYSISALEENRESVTENISAELGRQKRAEDTKGFYDMLMKENGKVVYKYVGDTSGETFDITIDPESI